MAPREIIKPHLFVICYPGSRLKNLGLEEMAIESHISEMQTLLHQAVISRYYFVVARQEADLAFQRDDSIINNCRENIKKTNPDLDFFQIDIFALMSAYNEQKNLGLLPKGLAHFSPFIHAQSFLYAVHMFGRMLDTFPNCKKSKEIKILKKEFQKKFPQINHLRNSVQHREEYIKGKSKNQKIEPKPVVNEIINAPFGGVTLHNCLIGNRYGNTLADGSYGEVEVCDSSVDTIGDILYNLIKLFEWTGPPKFEPRF